MGKCIYLYYSFDASEIEITCIFSKSSVNYLNTSYVHLLRYDMKRRRKKVKRTFYFIFKCM